MKQDIYKLDSKIYLIRCPICYRENFDKFHDKGKCAYCGYVAKDSDCKEKYVSQK